MASTQVNPTRMELTRLKKKLVTATRGHKLLKDKRDELMRQFLDLARENMALRLKVEEGIRSANKNFVIAKAGMSEQALNAALIAPKQEVYLETGKKNVMSVDIPEYNLSALINIVYVEKKDVVLATIIDITEQESQARKYYEKKLNTVELAHEVIRKQMTVAQEIAGLLGETAAETKITLLDLCDSLLEEGEKEQGTGSGKRRRGTASAEPGSEAEGRR